MAVNEETLKKQRLAAAKKLRDQLEKAQEVQRTQNERTFASGAQQLRTRAGTLADLGLAQSGYARSEARQAAGKVMDSLEDARAKRAQTQAKVERERKDAGLEAGMLGPDYQYKEQPVKPRYSDTITKELLKRLLRRQAGRR